MSQALNPTQAPNTITITQIEAIPLRVKLERSAQGSSLSLTHRCTILVRIYTNSEIIGECFMGNDDVLQPQIIHLIKNEMEPLLIGRPVVEIEENWNLTRSATIPFLRDRRVALRAQALIDAAMHDALGKIAQLPIHILWGGSRPQVPVFALGGYYHEVNDIEQLKQEVQEMREFGVGGIKVKVGKKSPAEDAARIAAAREAGGPEFIVAADANQSWTLQESLAFIQEVKEYNLAWLEEPCRWDNDRQELAFVRASGGIPITAGQSEISRFGCRDLLSAGAVDTLNFDSYWGGGPTEWRKAAALASAYGASAMQHLEPQIGPMMSAGIGNGKLAEVLMPWRDPFFYRLIGNMPETPFTNGQFTLSNQPGWGITIDEDYLAFARSDQ